MPSARLGLLGSGVEMPRSRAARMHVGPSDFLRQAHGRRIARPGESLAQADLPAIDAVAVDRGPAVDGDRLVLDQAVGGPAGAQRREIDEQLERRARLAPRLRRAVEGLSPCSSGRRPSRPPGRRAASRPAPPARRRPAAPAHRPHREPLQVGVERRAHLDLAEIGLERLRAEARPSRRNRCRSGPSTPVTTGRAGHGDAARAGLITPVSAIAASTSRPRCCAAREIVGRRQPRRRLDQAGEHRRLRQRQISG